VPIPRQSLPDYPPVTPSMRASGLQKKSCLVRVFISRNRHHVKKFAGSTQNVDPLHFLIARRENSTTCLR